MALPRTGISALNSIFRFASVATPPAARRCPQCCRPFSSFPVFRQSTRRQLQTATAYRPVSLEPEMPPPRNAGVPDTSIAGGVPKVDQSWPQGIKSQGQASVSEVEAQKTQPPNTKPTITSSTSTPEAAPAKPRRSKLRARKAAMTLSPKAVVQLRALFDQPESKLIRVGVKNRGCSGLAYHLEYVDKPGAFDESVEQDGVKVLIDSKALFSIIGSEMDWIEDKLNQRFIFKNPNISKLDQALKHARC